MKPFKIHKITMSPPQELLLRAALLPGDEALEAWRAWRPGVVLASLDHNSQRLLPLLYQNLSRLGISDPLMKPLRNLYRYNSLRNQGFLLDLLPVLKVFRQHDMSVMVLKGMPLALAYYGDLGLRPMHDLDLLVQAEDALRAIELLAASGWRTNLKGGAPLAGGHTASLVGRHFKNKSGTQIDLHWPNPLKGDEEGAAYWRAAEALQAQGASLLVMNPTDMLFFTLAHGLKHYGENTPRMIADMHLILVKSAPAIQWDRLTAKIRQNGLGLSARVLFRRMKNQLHTPIPGAFQKHLDAIEVPSRQRYAFYALNNLPDGAATFIKGCMSVTNDYLLSKTVQAPRPLSVVEYLKLRWGLRNRLEVPFAFISKMLGYLLKSLRPRGERFI